jgi:hypothetical protein
MVIAAAPDAITYSIAAFVSGDLAGRASLILASIIVMGNTRAMIAGCIRAACASSIERSRPVA